ncbi:MAG: hypothetical protein HYU97_04555 [Deltaproteobacteria bacterium]|nr:hypothetical protein [Deltaproteobacteria bacterium]
MGGLFQRYSTFLLILLTLTWSACGGRASSTASSGVDLNSTLAVIDAQDDSTGSDLMKALITNSPMLFALSDVPLTADYYTLPTNIWVYDPTVAPLDLINEILCSLDQTAHDQMVNRGAYKAQVDFALCNKDKDQSGSSNDQSAGNSSEQELEYWTVLSTRGSASDPEIVKVWIPFAGDDSEGASSTGSSEEESESSLLLGYGEIVSGPTSANPNGVFQIHFKESATDGSVGPTMNGKLGSSFDATTSENTLTMRMLESGSEFSFSSGATIVKNTTSKTLQGILSESFSGGGFSKSYEHKIAANENFVKGTSTEDGAAESKCKNRKAYNTYVYRYSLFDFTTGSQIDLDNPGIPLIYTNSNGESNFCYASYWGLWCDRDEYPSSGGTLTGEEDGSTYTFLGGDFRVIKRTRETMALADFINVRLDWWINDQAIQIVWTGSVFQEVAECTFTMGKTCTDLSSPETIDISSFGGNMVYFWLDGVGSINVPIVSFTNSSAVYVTAEDNVNSADALFSSGTATLYGGYQQIKPDLTDSTYSDPYLPTLEGGAYTLQIDPTTWTATYVANASGTINTDNLTSAAATTGQNTWGVHSGDLYTSTSALQDAENQTIYYQIETGPNAWNTHREIQLNGAAVAFDRPLKCSYTYTDPDTSIAQLYQMEYGGAGDFWGVPWEEVADGLWRPKFTIPDGDSVTCKDSDGNETTYLVRALDKEQQLQDADESNCAGLSTEFNLSLPDTNFTDPNIGDLPDAELKVIQGVVIGN